MSSTLPGAIGGRTGPAAGEATVFVVDDDPGMRTSLAALARAAGLGVETYASGAEFLTAYDRERAGCLVLDVCLGDGSGLDVQDELNRRGTMMPIIFMTGHGTMSTCARALAAGATAFLLKPVSPRMLLAHIRNAIETDRRAREGATVRLLDAVGVVAPVRS